MKKWVIFSLLKIFEVSLILLFLFFAYKIGCYHIPRWNWFFKIIYGASIIVGVCLIAKTIYFLIKITIPLILHKNIEWAEKISSKIGMG